MPDTTQFGNVSDDSHLEGALKANTVLMSRYRILGVIGGGGMGTVYQARDLNFPDAKRFVAIKEMQTNSVDPNLRNQTFKTFQREANILATLSHPAIPKIFDFFDANDRAYLVMEYITGSDLELLLSKTKELPVDKILEWSIDLCDVLDYLHGHKPEPIMFRDLKPANIMIDSLGKVRLIDFGIAKMFVSGAKHTMIGTEGYSAPEQYKGDVTPLSDIYGLGATLHHVLTRKDPRLEPPFSFSERPILDSNPKVHPAFVATIERALANKPEERFQSCAEMKAALEAVRYRPSAATATSMPLNRPAMPGQTSAVSGKPAATSFFDDLTEASSSIQPRWKFTVEDEIRAAPTAYKELAFVGSYDTNVWAINLEDGNFVWKYATNAGIATSPVVDTSNKLVMFGSEDNSFTAVDYKTGRINWSYMTKGRVRSTATVEHGHVFFGSDDGKLYALVAGNGRFLWQYDMASPIRTRPAVTNEYVIAASESGDIVGLELSGKRKWAYRAKRAVNSSPFVDMKENICYVGSFDGFMYALDATSGYTLWRFRTNGPVISSAAFADGTVYFGSADGNLYAVNGENGKEKWHFTTTKPIVGTPVVHENLVYFGGTDCNFYCVDARSGKELWKYEAKGQITSAPYISENMILFGSMDKVLYALPLVG